MISDPWVVETVDTVRNKVVGAEDVLVAHPVVAVVNLDQRDIAKRVGDGGEILVSSIKVANVGERCGISQGIGEGGQFGVAAVGKSNAPAVIGGDGGQTIAAVIVENEAAPQPVGHAREQRAGIGERVGVAVFIRDADGLAAAVESVEPPRARVAKNQVRAAVLELETGEGGRNR